MDKWALAPATTALRLQGSGKTLAFGLPILNFLVIEARRLASANASAAPAKPPASRSMLRALILCPTRELAMQVAAHLTAIATPLAVRVVPIVGGVSLQKQARLLGYRPPVVVATPGRLWDVMRGGSVHLTDLTHLSFLVLDEADRMVKQGHYEELAHILAAIPEPAPKGSSRGARSAMPTPGNGHVVGATAAQREPEEEATMTAAELAGPLRTYVFSATLTMPQSLKARLQRGHGGSRGSGSGASFESLMERITFRGKPKVCRVGCCSVCGGNGLVLRCCPSLQI
jgi:ATP-dependent RNA helicase DDX24/MAK5